MRIPGTYTNLAQPMHVGQLLIAPLNEVLAGQTEPPPPKMGTASMQRMALKLSGVSNSCLDCLKVAAPLKLADDARHLLAVIVNQEKEK